LFDEIRCVFSMILPPVRT